jgi:Uma2 family endonuclease
MILKTQHYIVEEFDEFVNLPQNADKLFEYIRGEIFEVPSYPYSSKIPSRISGYLFMYLNENDIGHLTGEAGGYMVSGERYAPDVSFTSYETQANEVARRGYNPIPPDLAVEVMSPTDIDKMLRVKIANYQAAGTIVWLTNPDKENVEVYEIGKPIKFVGRDGRLSAQNLLPDFELKVDNIFPKKPESDG